MKENGREKRRKEKEGKRRGDGAKETDGEEKKEKGREGRRRKEKEGEGGVSVMRAKEGKEGEGREK
jgi:hypothetical protein